MLNIPFGLALIDLIEEAFIKKTRVLFSFVLKHQLCGQGPRNKFTSGGGGGFERQTSKMSQLGPGESGGMLPRKILIFTPLKCRKKAFKSNQRHF